MTQRVSQPVNQPVPSGLRYHELHRSGAPGWWRPVVGVLALVFLTFVIAPFVIIVVFMAGFVITGEDLRASTERLVDTDSVTPLGLAFLNLALAASILAAWVVTRVFHGLKPRWLSSVLPRIRWSWFTVCFGLSFVALLATLVVAALLPDAGTGTTMSGELNGFTSTTRDFLLVVALLTPLQAAGEEYAFRGYLTQAFGGLFRSPIPAVIVPSVLFALAHGAQDAPIFLDRLAFGLVAGIAVIVTGGLEAGIAMHVLNNWLAFGLALAYGDMSSALNPTGGSWWSLPVTLTQSLVYLGLTVLVARRMGVRTRTQPVVLEALGSRV